MDQRFGTLLLCLLTMTACELPSAVRRQPAAVTEHTLRSEAANRLTERCAASRIKDWKVRATAAGADCGVLLVETSVVMESSAIDAMHYGVADYDFLPGGVSEFCQRNLFRGAAYRDASAYVQTYGDVTAAEAQSLKPCR